MQNVERVDRVNGFHLEGGGTVLGEHGCDCGQHNLGLMQIGGCDLNENVFGLQCNLHSSRLIQALLQHMAFSTIQWNGDIAVASCMQLAIGITCPASLVKTRNDSMQQSRPAVDLQLHGHFLALEWIAACMHSARLPARISGTHSGMCAIDDWWQGQHSPVGIQYHRIHWGALNDGHVALEPLIVVCIVLRAPC